MQVVINFSKIGVLAYFIAHRHSAYHHLRIRRSKDHVIVIFNFTARSLIAYCMST